MYRFSFAEPKDHQIKVGDIVLISKGEPLKAAAEATVSAVGKRYVEVMTKERLFKSKLYRVDLFVSDITFKRMRKAIENIENSEFDPEIILGKREPEVVQCDTKSDKLNESQNEALRLALNSELFLIHGPPGTGKTTTLAEVVRKNIGKGRILVSADSNVAIDNMLEKLKDRKVVRIGHPAKINDELMGFSIDALIREDPRYLEVQRMIDGIDEFKRVRDKNYQKPTPSQRRGLTNDEILTLAAQDKGKRGLRSSKIKKMAGWIELNNKIAILHEQKEAILNKIIQEKLRDAEVIFTTNSGAGSEFLEDFKFDMLFLDEAAQCVEPSALIPIIRSKRVIMAGDHKQLPPTILSDAKRLSYTLFERFENLFNASYILRIQYRMNDKICKFSSCEFYDCLVESSKSVKDIKLSDIADTNEFVGYDEPMVFFDTEGRFLEASKKGSYSKYNPLEAEFVKRLVDELLSLGVKPCDIGVITPYKDHEEYMRRMIDSVEIKSIDGFQGREKEVIILSLVRANDNEEIGFLRDKRRLNVAITRAKRKLMIVGDAKTLASHRIYARLIDYILKQGLFKPALLDYDVF